MSDDGHFDETLAASYDDDPDAFDPATVNPAVDLLAELAGLTPDGSWADWRRAPFTADSDAHVSVWRRPAA